MRSRLGSKGKSESWWPDHGSPTSVWLMISARATGHAGVYSRGHTLNQLAGAVVITGLPARHGLAPSLRRLIRPHQVAPAGRPARRIVYRPDRCRVRGNSEEIRRRIPCGSCLPAAFVACACSVAGGQGRGTQVCWCAVARRHREGRGRRRSPASQRANLIRVSCHLMRSPHLDGR